MKRSRLEVRVGGLFVSMCMCTQKYVYIKGAILEETIL